MTVDGGPPGLSDALGDVDPEIAALIAAERSRQQSTIDMIASENVVPRAVLEAQGSILTNKYADGYPGAREYDGCEVVDTIEQLAIDRAKHLFGADHANVQPYSGSSANQAVLAALCGPGDPILGFDFDHGGHPTQYDRQTFAGQFYDGHAYGVREADRLIDCDQVREIALRVRPKVIFAGGSAYPRTIDFGAFRSIADEVGAYLVADMAHFSGLVAAGLYPNPVPYADVCTMTVHKTLGGPRGGAIVSKASLARLIDEAVFPGVQGAPLVHVIAAKAVTFALCGTESFRERMARTVAGARTIAGKFHAAAERSGIDVVTGGTDVHLVLLDVTRSGERAGDLLDALHLVGVNANAMRIAFDPQPRPSCSGLRLGTASLATRGFAAAEFETL
ncbi:MAG TPA: serine hydroxymethyltransferase, partial [Acidimicrobiales bacterium]|nr:serine hydroxymethyltransferase [Acidimicrobiales bacterium]